MPINATPHYFKAEAEYLQAQTTEQKIFCLKKMLALAPKHKGAENLLKQLKTRLKKLKYSNEKESKSKSSSKHGIKKSEMQAVLIGKTNSGKSSLLNLLTNTSEKISEIPFTSKKPKIGILEYASTQIQIIENPAIESEFYDKGLTNSADTLLIVINSLDQIQEMQNLLNTSKKIPENKTPQEKFQKIQNQKNNFQNKNSQKEIFIFNKSDILDTEQKRKIQENLKSKKLNYILVSTKSQEGLEDLKGKIFQSFSKIRIYTKDPNSKTPDKTKPIILNQDSTIQDVAEKILHGFSKKITKTKIWGPSSKFAGQEVGLNHKVQDNDIVEFKTR